MSELDLTNLTDVDDESVFGDEAASTEAMLHEVEVSTEQLEGRKRQLTATIQIPYAIEQIWQILTDYDRLADFIPNLTKSERINHPQGGIRLEQIGSQSFLRLKFCARVVLDMVEHFPDRIEFHMVEGDFKEFSGFWQLQPQLIGGQSCTHLCYTIQVLPPRTMPIGLIERRLRQNLALNLTSIRDRAHQLFGIVH